MSHHEPSSADDTIRATQGQGITSATPKHKRQRPTGSRSDLSYARKRATYACRPCRARKVKCNNGRPSCGACLISGATCGYEDSRDYSAFDPASKLILDRLDRMLLRVEQLPCFMPIEKPSETSSVILATDLLRTQEEQEQSHTTFDELRIPSARTTPDSILQWPIFDHRYPPNYIVDIAFEGHCQYQLPPLVEPDNSTLNVCGINEDAIPELVQSFLELVHIKNPILDARTLLLYAHDVAEEGLKWDSKSCLVLLASALGCVARPFPSNPSTCTHHGKSSLEVNHKNLRNGDAYFTMARKRIGLLEHGIIVPQCQFLAGMYYMYTLRPLTAWSQFYSASMSCHVYLQREARRPHSHQDPNATSRLQSLEERLYWSCYKSECELRIELDLPSSSLADVHYAHNLPSPPYIYVYDPQNTKKTPGVDSVSLTLGIRKGLPTQVHQEESWLYYLTEITLRRIANRILNTFYTINPSRWDDSIMPYLAKAAMDFEQQLEEWYLSLPKPIHFDEDKIPDKELPYMVRDRLLEIKSWLYRPFLYYAIHNPPDAPCRTIAEQYVEKSLLNSVRAMQSIPIYHRHHGTWFSIQSASCIALSIIGAAKCKSIALPDGWNEALVLCIERLRFWQDECMSVSRALEVLEDWIQNVFS